MVSSSDFEMGDVVAFNAYNARDRNRLTEFGWRLALLVPVSDGRSLDPLSVRPSTAPGDESEVIEEGSLAGGRKIGFSPSR